MAGAFFEGVGKKFYITKSQHEDKIKETAASNERENDTRRKSKVPEEPRANYQEPHNIRGKRGLHVWWQGKCVIM